MKPRTLLLALALVALLALLVGGALFVLRPVEGPDTDTTSADTTTADEEPRPTDEAAEDDLPVVELTGPRAKGAGPHFSGATADAEGDGEGAGAFDALSRHDWNAIGVTARELRRAAASVAANELADRDAPHAEYVQVDARRDQLHAQLEPLRADLGLHPVEAVLQHPVVYANVVAAMLHAEGEPLTRAQVREIDAELARLLERHEQARRDWDHERRPLVAKYEEARFAHETRRLIDARLSRDQRRASRPGDGYEISRLDPFSPAIEFLGASVELIFRGESVEPEWIAQELQHRLPLPGLDDEFETVARAWVESLPPRVRRPVADDWHHLRMLHRDDEVLEYVRAEVELRDLMESTLELDAASRLMIRRMPVVWRFTRKPQ